MSKEKENSSQETTYGEAAANQYGLIRRDSDEDDPIQFDFEGELLKDTSDIVCDNSRTFSVNTYKGKQKVVDGEEEKIAEDEVKEDTDSRELKNEEAGKKNYRLSQNLKGFYGYKCYFDDLLREVNELAPKFDEKIMTLLSDTPFGMFFKMLMNRNITKLMTEKSTDSIVDIIGLYAGKGCGFRLNGRSDIVELTPEDVSFIFGLPMAGLTFDTTAKVYGTCGVFEQKYFKNNKRVTKKDLDVTIKKILSNPNISDCDRRDVVRLIILYTFPTFFFASTCGSLSKVFLKKFDSFRFIHICSWPKMIHSFLMKSIIAHHRKPASISGCVYVLLYFLLEHTDIAKPVRGAERLTPRALRWNLANVAGSNWPETFEKLNQAKVIAELVPLNEIENKLVGKKSKIVDTDRDSEVIEHVNPIGFVSQPDLIDEMHKFCEEVERTYGKKNIETVIAGEHEFEQNVLRERWASSEEINREQISGKRMNTSQDQSRMRNKRRRITWKKLAKKQPLDEIITDEDEPEDQHFTMPEQEDEDIQIEDLPDDVDKLKFLFIKENGLRRAAEYRLKRLGESAEYKKRGEQLSTESEKFKKEVNFLTDYWEGAYKLVREQNSKLEKSFASYVDAFDRERHSNEIVRAELESRLEQLNDDYGRIVMENKELLKEKIENASKTHEVLKELSAEKLRTMEYNEKAARSASCTEHVPKVDAKYQYNDQTEMLDPLVEQVYNQGCTPEPNASFKKSIFDAQELRIRLRDSEDRRDKAEERCTNAEELIKHLRDEIEALNEHKKEMSAELVKANERFIRIYDEEVSLRTRLEKESAMSTQRAKEMLELNAQIEELHSELFDKIPNEQETRETQEENAGVTELVNKLREEADKFSDIVEQKNKLVEEDKKLRLDLRDLNELVKDISSKKPETARRGRQGK